MIRIYAFISILVVFLQACNNGSSSESDQSNKINHAPEITLLGDTPLVLMVNDTYNEPGATVYDFEDGDISNLLLIEGQVDTSIIGEYQRTYTVMDSQNLTAAVTRSVFIVNSTQQPDTQYFRTDNLINFDGSNYITVASNSLLSPRNALTIEAWIYAKDISGQKGIAGNWNDIGASLRTYLFWIQDSKVELLISQTGGDFPRASVDISDKVNQWVHVAGTYDGQEIKVYLNGSLAATTPLPGSIFTNNLPFYIGRTDSGSNGIDYFNGYISDLRLWNVARTETQIRSSMSQQPILSEQGLVAAWNLNGGSGITILESVNGLDGALFSELWELRATPGPIVTKVDMDQLLEIGGVDYSGLGISAKITQLPVNGSLYQTDDGINPSTTISLDEQISNPNGYIIYRSNSGFSGADDFGFKVTNRLQESEVTILGITVLPN